MNFVLKKYLALVVMVLTFVFMTEVASAQVETKYKGNLPADVESQLKDCKGDWTRFYIDYSGVFWVLNCLEGNSWVSVRSKLD